MKANKEKARKILVRPFTYITQSVGDDSLKMCVLLGIQLLFLIISTSYKAVSVIIVSLVASILADILDKKLQDKKEDSDSFSIQISAVQGLITGFLLPENYPLVTVFLVTFFSMALYKYMFGGYARAWLNPSIVSVACLWVIGSRVFPDFLVSFDILSMRNPSQFLIESGIFPNMKFDSQITDALNNSIFSLFKVSVPEGYVSMFWDTGSVIPAFRFNFLTILSSIIIFGEDYVKAIIPFTFLAVYFILIRYISPFFIGSIQIKGDVLLAMLTGGTLFYATFVTGWYGTAPATIPGKILTGLFAGSSAFFIAGPGTSPSGLVFSVLLTNVFSLIIVQSEAHYDRIRMEKLVCRKEASFNAD